MSFTITENFVTQWSSNFHLLAQQSRSRLEQFVSKRPAIVGSSFTEEVMASAEAQQITTRHGDTPFQNVVQSRRIADMKDYDWGELVDQMDKIKMLADPTSDYTRQGVAALNRWKDGTIVSALLGAARTNTGTTALPAGQIIANGGTGLTLAKLRSAKRKLDAAEQNDEAFFEMSGYNQTQQAPFGNYATPSYVLVVSAGAIDNLLSTTEATSADYNSVKALVSGSIDTFMGFKFVRLPDSGPSALPIASTIRSLIAYAPKALSFGTGADIVTRMQERADKRFSVQVYASMSVGAVRREDLGVVQIDVVES